MHTYRKRGTSWEVGFQRPSDFNQIGPRFNLEHEAAAFASFMNGGGHYSPYEVEALFRQEPASDQPENEPTHPDRPKALDDYPQEQSRSRVNG